MTAVCLRNIKLTLEYQGTHYCGWQVQDRASVKKPSIQMTIENALFKLLGKKVKLIGSGRTDAGVHAREQVANFKTKSAIKLDKLRLGLNALLPEDIAVTRAEEVPAAFHSRFDAKSKLYRYSVLNRTWRSALMRDFVYLFPHKLDLDLMRRESKSLLGKHDFRAFRTCDGEERDTVKVIKDMKINRSGGLISIDLEADGFLYNMARSIVGTLLEIGRGKLPAGSLRSILLSRDRRKAGPCVPAKGLCLVKVEY